MTTTASFLTVPEVCDIHLYQLEHFGGMSGTREPNLLAHCPTPSDVHAH